VKAETNIRDLLREQIVPRHDETERARRTRESLGFKSRKNARSYAKRPHPTNTAKPRIINPSNNSASQRDGAALKAQAQEKWDLEAERHSGSLTADIELATIKNAVSSLVQSTLKRIHASVSYMGRIAPKKKGYTTVVIIGAVILGLNTISSDSSKPTEPETLGASSPAVEQAEPQILKRQFATEFDLILPQSKTLENTEVVKVSPEGNDPVYAYLDVISGAEIRVSQQQIPEDFASNVDAEVERVAASFQATKRIQLDGQTIYHGQTTQNGGVQSLVLHKEGVLLLISSSQVFSDDVWVGYILSLS